MRHLLALSVALLPFAFSNAQAQELINLGDLGGGGTLPDAINNSDQIVGISRTARQEFRAFLYTGGKMIELGDERVQGGAAGLNDAGDVVGVADQAGEHYAFLYSGGKLTTLGVLPGDSASSANAINNVGQIVGTSGQKAFLYYKGQMASLGLLPGGTYSIPKAINSAGQIVGVADNSNQERHAFLYANGGMTDLGTVAGGHRSEANGINASGQIAGVSTTSDGFEDAFLYAHGKMTDLGTMPGTAGTMALGINDAGQIVGISLIQMEHGGSKAFIYSPNKGFQDLDVLYASLLVPDRGSQTGFTHLQMATGINIHGSIIGVGQYWDGVSTQRAGFLLRTGFNWIQAIIWIGSGAVALVLIALMFFLWRLPAPSENEPKPDAQNPLPESTIPPPPSE